MTKPREPKGDFDVGYGKPPHHTRFPKGRSGNPGGAPKKKKKDKNNMILAARYPTRSIIRDEGARTVTIREGQDRKEVPVTQAIMMALEQTALKGGVLAQRTYLEMQLKQDDVYIAERREKFERWRDIKAESEAELALAKKSGRDVREVAPHPDDIILNYVTYEVTILGAVNAQDRQEELRQARLRDLFYELSSYYGEGNVRVEGDDKASKMGVFLTSYICTEINLPPSLRRSSDDLKKVVLDKLLLPHCTWSDDLEARCQEFGLPFFYTPSGKSRKFAFPLEDLGFGWRDGQIEPVRPDVIRERNRMFKALYE